MKINMRRHGDMGNANSPDYDDAMGGIGLRVAMNSIAIDQLEKERINYRHK